MGLIDAINDLVTTNKLIIQGDLVIMSRVGNKINLVSKTDSPIPDALIIAIYKALIGLGQSLRVECDNFGHPSEAGFLPVQGRRVCFFLAQSYTLIEFDDPWADLKEREQAKEAMIERKRKEKYRSFYE